VIFLTNDLTPAVLDEAVARRASLVVTYHPTPFSALKKFPADGSASSAARVVLTAAANNMAVYSPHTAWDVARPGLNDWLVEGIVASASLPAPASVRPLIPSDNADAAAAGVGDGRVAALAGPATLLDVIRGVKAHLSLDHVQVSLPGPLLAVARKGAREVLAAAGGLAVSAVAVCAGSGASMVGAVKPGSVFVTGEMSHHEVLAASASGVAVLLTHHSKCERGYLAVMKGRLEAEFAAMADPLHAGEGVSVVVSEVDADPLTIV
jgi:putative NIF3 family GTP cyclohydrolase 1 type 2